MPQLESFQSCIGSSMNLVNLTEENPSGITKENILLPLYQRIWSTNPVQTKINPYRYQWQRQMQPPRRTKGLTSALSLSHTHTHSLTHARFCSAGNFRRPNHTAHDLECTVPDSQFISRVTTVRLVVSRRFWNVPLSDRNLRHRPRRAHGFFGAVKRFSCQSIPLGVCVRACVCGGVYIQRVCDWMCMCVGGWMEILLPRFCLPFH